MSSPTPSLDLEQFLPFRLSRLSNRISQAIADIYVERFNLSVTEWRVMAVLGRSPGLSANAVAERTAMDKVAVSRAVARLITAGRVTRDTAEGDRRRSVLHLSPAGQRIYHEVVPLVIGIESQLVDQLDDDTRRQLMHLLGQLEQAVP